jgi:hypothetical protein
VDGDLQSLSARVLGQARVSGPGAACPRGRCWPGVIQLPQYLYIAAALTFDACYQLLTIDVARTPDGGISLTTYSRGRCPPGGYAAAAPPVSLLALPSADVRPGTVPEVTVHVQ